MAAGALACLGFYGICVVYLYDGVYLQPARQADGANGEADVAGGRVTRCRRMMAAGWMEPSFWKGGLWGPAVPAGGSFGSQETSDCPTQLRLTAHGGSRGDHPHHRTSGIFSWLIPGRRAR